MFIFDFLKSCCYNSQTNFRTIRRNKNKKYVYSLALFFFVLSFISVSSVVAFDEYSDSIEPVISNVNKLKYSDFLELYKEQMHLGNYKKALLYSRFLFANSSNIEQRANSLMCISAVFVAQGNTKKAKMIYRQIVQNYSKQHEVVKEAKMKLLQL